MSFRIVFASALAFGLITTALTHWLVNRFYHPQGRRVATWTSLTDIVADLIWVLILTAGGVVVVRYAERLTSVAFGYAIAGLAAGLVLLSLLRAFVYCRSKGDQPMREFDWEELPGVILHAFTYLLFAVIIYLALSLLRRQALNPVLVVYICIGALLPGLDSQESVMGRLLPFISRPLETRLGQCQEWHTLAANALVALLTAPLILVNGLQSWGLISLGFLSHLILDMFGPPGIMLFWPFAGTRYLFGGWSRTAGSASERRLAIILVMIAAVLLLVKGSQTPTPTPAPPSFEIALQHAYALRGRSLVVADVEGTWQATGRRISGSYEVLNVLGSSFIMRDGYTGQVFTAGQGASDNLYLNRVTVTAGSAIQVKPVEIRLQDQSLADVLPVVYGMQREPGLQHIFVSGDLIMPADGAEGGLSADYSQTHLRQIQVRGPGHYGLYYLPASELIELANIQVQVADLLVVATYVIPAAGPTATPLPLPPPQPGASFPEGEGTP
jgi:inner membrane protein